jgi:hypothetical protein
LARTLVLTFCVELVSYELAVLTELAYARKSAAVPRLLDAVLEFEGIALGHR